MKPESFKKGKAVSNVLRNACQFLEFATRVSLVNIPSYLQAVSPELDRICPGLDNGENERIVNSSVNTFNLFGLSRTSSGNTPKILGKNQKRLIKPL
jgi:hypothetical protein